MNKLLQQIAELPYISTGTPLTTTDIANYQSTLLQHGLPLMPKDYQKFLLSYNGILSEGNIIFGLSAIGHFLYDLLGENAYADNPTPQNLLLLGASETIYIGWQKSKNLYQMIDKSNFMVLHEFDNLSDAIKCVLKIND